MDTKESVNADVSVTAMSLPPSSGFLNELLIIRPREVEKIITDENGHNVTSLGSYPDSPPSNPFIFLKFQHFEANYIYDLVHPHLHDHVLSKQISDRIVVKAQQLRSDRSSDHLPLFMGVSVIFTRKVYKVLPCNCAPSTPDLVEKEAAEEETEACAICLEDMLESGFDDKQIYRMHNCWHMFYEGCVMESLNR